MIKSLEWKVGGQQGEGVDSTGEIFAKTLFRYGYYVTTYKQFMSRIKGGHTNYKIRATNTNNIYHGEKLDILLCLDEETLQKNEHELKNGAVAILENKDKEISIEKTEKGYILASFPLKKIATELGNALAKNMIALGISGAISGLPIEQFFGFIEETFAKKGEKVIASNKEAVQKGYDLAKEYLNEYSKQLAPVEKKEERLFISGNEATAFGAFMAGCRYNSFYPITPASEVAEWQSAQFPKHGGIVMQVEDEIAGITFAIGAAAAGARAMTSTSGPGLSLKTEALGLAGISETGIVIVDSQRSGPSTGLPTKHEQSDVFHMLHGGHGELPRIVLYPSSIEDAFYVAAEAFNLAEMYQCPVFVALDLQMSMNKTTIPTIDSKKVKINRGKILTPEQVKELGERTFKRYRFTEDGVSPRALPGTEGGVHTLSSNEHGEDGYIMEDPFIRTKMMQKRMEKIKTARLQVPYYAFDTDRDTILLGMGSTRGVIEEVKEMLEKEGIHVGHLHIQQLNPLPADEIETLLQGKKVISIENNYEAQLLSWIKQHIPIHKQSHSITQYDGNPFIASDVYEQVRGII